MGLDSLRYALPPERLVTVGALEGLWHQRGHGVVPCLINQPPVASLSPWPLPPPGTMKRPVPLEHSLYYGGETYPVCSRWGKGGGGQITSKRVRRGGACMRLAA